MNRIFNRARQFFLSDEGPTATEYAVMLALIAAVVVTAMGQFGVKMENIYVTLTTALDVF